MQILDPGHEYILRSLDVDNPKVDSPVVLTFVKREGPGYPGNVGHHSGTTTQEVLRALIDRTKYVDNQIHSPHNNSVLFHLQQAIWELEVRAAKRHGRVLSPLAFIDIENQPTCEKCGHIGCKGECH